MSAYAKKAVSAPSVSLPCSTVHSPATSISCVASESIPSLVKRSAVSESSVALSEHRAPCRVSRDRVRLRKRLRSEGVGVVDRTLLRDAVEPDDAPGNDSEAPQQRCAQQCRQQREAPLGAQHQAEAAAEREQSVEGLLDAAVGNLLEPVGLGHETRRELSGWLPVEEGRLLREHCLHEPQPAAHARRPLSRGKEHRRDNVTEPRAEGKQRQQPQPAGEAAKRRAALHDRIEELAADARREQLGCPQAERDGGCRQDKAEACRQPQLPPKPCPRGYGGVSTCLVIGRPQWHLRRSCALEDLRMLLHVLSQHAERRSVRSELACHGRAAAPV
eukprot:1966450-Prymnesium_polylepis.1